MRLPAGLNNNGLEIYRDPEGRVRVIQNGNRTEYLELPLVLREPFQAELIADQDARNTLINDLRITNADEMEEMFVGCRYGTLDSHPDLKDGHLTHDLPVCDKMKTCPAFGKVCKQPEGPGGKLSRTQYLIAIEVAKGKLDKEITEEFQIELPTVRTHLNRIREKLNVNNRIEIALWTQRHSIV